MTNLELQEILKQYSDDVMIFIDIGEGKRNDMKLKEVIVMRGEAWQWLQLVPARYHRGAYMQWPI